MKRKTKFELEKENYQLKLAGVIMIISLLIVVSGLTCLTFKIETSEKQMLNETNFTTNLDVISSNCGSTFLTKKYNDDNWYIFAQKCKGDYCKSDYIKLEDCLK